MGYQQIDATCFSNMIRAGAENLARKVEEVNALNVFPVPDGDTGTNMNLTIASGVREMEQVNSNHVGKLAEALSKGLLMGARGNSGVILSQLFRGFSKYMAEQDVITGRQLADAFKHGVDTAYKAVIKPVEGTVLTVSREAAESGVIRSRQTEDPAEVMAAILNEAKRSLERTPDLLPILAKTGVVDAGGQGLVYIYEGMLNALRGEVVESEVKKPETAATTAVDSLSEIAHSKNAQSKIGLEEIEHGYCTEFIIKLNPGWRKTEPFDEEAFRREVGAYGDSLLVVCDDDLVKLHIHAEKPGDVLNVAIRYGDLTRIKIDNMREQHSELIQHDQEVAPTEENVPALEEAPEPKRYGIITVSTGDGLDEIFRSLGVDQVIEGGQTMNPSTEDIVRAIQKTSSEHVFVLPNNKNIILAAEQAAEVVDVPVTVLPTKSILQGLTALLSFDSEADPEQNEQNMMNSLQGVKSGEVTYAVRDSQMDGKMIKEGDFLGICEGKIESVGGSLLATSRDLLQRMLGNGADLVTIIYGKDVTDAQVKDLTDFMKRSYPEVEIEVHYGGQPLYFFLFGVE